MTLQHLKSFYTVAKMQSFTKSAQILHLTQPAVTAHIKALEAYLDVTLFERNRASHNIALTYEGEKLLSYAERIFALMDEMETAFHEMKTLHKRGKVVIGTTAVIGIYILPSIFRQFRIQYPEITLDNRIGNSQWILDRLLASNVEIGIIRKIGEFPAHLAVRFFHSERLLWIAAPHHPLAQKAVVSLDEIQQNLFIHREAGTRTRDQLDLFLRKQGITNLPSIEVGHIEAVKKAVEDGIGLSVVPEISVQRELQSRLLTSLPVEGFDLSAEYYLVYVNDRNLSNATQAFLHTLQHLSNLRKTHKKTKRG